MGFLDRFSPTQYTIRSVLFRPDRQEDGSFEIEAEFELVLYSAEGQNLTHAKESVALTDTERQQFLAFVNGKREAFEQATGLTWYNSGQ